MGEDQQAKGEPYLRISALTKMFGPFTALKDISLKIYEGEFVCFLGPSGCGKTTLLRAIAGLDIQTTGKVEQAGQDISALPPSERDFGIVFQSYALFPNMSVNKNIAYGLENRKTPKEAIRRRVEELLELVGLPEQGDKYPAQLSGGQQQRIALARAIAVSPGLLLLDEPLSALDAKVRVHLRHEVKDLQRRLGITTVMVTHDQEEALTMADRIVVMDHGKIEQIGTPLEIYREPRTSFVADFIGTMNFVPGTICGPDSVRYGQLELACDTDGLARGTPVTIAVRPEDIVVQSVRADEENVYEARVGGLEFLGSFVRADLSAEMTGDDGMRADLSINLVRHQNITEGDMLMVRLPRERILIYPGTVTRE
ncbi:MAG: putative 2-aminoethylphosphonate ABC transporter ATP-binding protein [Gammaproteobacteria bacterium]|jgi:iron(III) transport system ATP-binding protein|nr:putative 2-aminoethylphosphonate ABC transporter ATP-binding protein [Gammaproteobacteria bacterium]MDX2459086.1 putative 2-aminoethylphosphonate ABC transporter ATP-binding protein [Gammaproteobacteria bacterium]